MKKKIKALRKPTRALIRGERVTASGANGTASAPVAPAPEAAKMALLAAEAALDKKAEDIEIIDVTGKVDYTDYLVLMTGQSDRHVGTIARAVDEALSRNGFAPIAIEGLTQGEWVLLDFVDIVVHVFLADTRSLYDIDGLWMDARRVPVPHATPVTPT